MTVTRQKTSAGLWPTLALGLASLVFAPMLVPARLAAQESPVQPASPSTEPAAVSMVTEPASVSPTTEPASATPSTEPASASRSTEPVKPTPTIPLPAPGTPISLNFKDVPLQTVLEYLSGVAGLVIVEGAKVEGRVTVVSMQNISVDAAVSLLDSVLRQKGYAAIKNGRTLKIVTTDQAKTELIPVRTGNDPSKVEPSDRIVTHIIPIRYADAVKLKADLASLVPASTDVASNASSNTLIVTGTEATIRRLMEVIQAIDVHMSEVSQVKVFTLQYANATAAARLVTEIFKSDQTQSGNQGGGGRRAFMFGPGGISPTPADSSSGAPAVKVIASADDRTNTLIVSAPPDVMKVIEGVVKDLDANPAAQQATFIYHVKNAQAVNLEGVLNTVFGNTTTTSRSTQAGQNTGSSGTGTSSGGVFGNRAGSSSSSSSRGLSSGQSGASSSRNNSASGTGRTTGRTIGGATGASGSGAASDLAGKVSVVADADTNSLVVTTDSNNFDRVKAILADLDRAVPQVLIKVLMAEVTHDSSLDIGMEFSLINMSTDGTSYSIGSDFDALGENRGFTFKIDNDNFNGLIHMLAKRTKLDVLSRPYILTGDNQEASIMVGKEVPFVTNSRITDAGDTINTIEYDEIGIILNVTPHINPQGLVTMDVYPEISALTGDNVTISETADGGTVTAPVFARRFAQSRVAVRDGQTIVIGGLMEDHSTENIKGIPVLMDIPWLGALFRRSIMEKSKTELLIFITPHVAKRPDDLPSMTESEKSGTKIIQKAVAPGEFDEHLKGMGLGAAAPESSENKDGVTESDNPDTKIIRNADRKEESSGRNEDSEGNAAPPEPPAGEDNGPPPEAP